MGILEGEGGGRAVLPRLGAQVVVEARASGHGLGVEVSREGAVLRAERKLSGGNTLCDKARPHGIGRPGEM